jgi:hypothetical protein
MNCGPAKGKNDTATFCKSMIAAAKDWQKDSEQNQTVNNNPYG